MSKKVQAPASELHEMNTCDRPNLGYGLPVSFEGKTTKDPEVIMYDFILETVNGIIPTAGGSSSAF